MMDAAGLAGQLQINQQIEALIKRKDAANEPYSDEDKAFIAQYEGGGGQKGAKGRGVLDEFYTPEYICALMWDFAYKYGFTQGQKVLEPSCATGRFFKFAPKESHKVGFELNPTSFRITQILYPEVEIYNDYFETAFLQPPRFSTKAKESWLGEDFGLVIGNPPYGKHANLYSSYFGKPKVHQIENFFMYYGLKLLRKNGLVIYLTSSNFMRNSDKYTDIKGAMGKIATLVDAYRLPPVFKTSKVPTDILIFQKL